MTPSEAYVNQLCKRAFLSLWTIPSPMGKEPGKELCDALVVCAPHVIVISVKEVVYKETEDIEIGWNRWLKTAVEKSVKQLSGAKRFLDSSMSVSSMNGKVSLELPVLKDRRYHLLTISLGGQRQVPVSLPSSQPFIHFVDEGSINILFQELDTISDFVEFLEKKESFFLSQKRLVVGAEEDLVAFYLHNGRSFPDEGDALVIDDEVWAGFAQNKQFLAKKSLDEISYFWDSIIEECINLRDSSITNPLGYVDNSETNLEKALRVLAKENRFSRRVLSENFWEFHRDPKIASRATKSVSGEHAYVFLKKPISTPRGERQNELYARCFIIKSQFPEVKAVIGIATEDDISKGHSLDLLYFEKDTWTERDQQTAQKAAKELQLFVAPRISKASADEYPPISKNK